MCGVKAGKETNGTFKKSPGPGAGKLNLPPRQKTGPAWKNARRFALR
jgi:hypothetical protein